MRLGRLVIAGTAAAAAAAVLTLGGALAEEPRAASGPGSIDRAAADPAQPTKDAVRSLQARARARPRDAALLAELGLVYLQRARETGDAAYLVRAERVLRRSLRAGGPSAKALTGLGSVALSRHDFRAALRLGRRAAALAPREATALGVVADALVELGRYEQAFRAFDRLVELDPGTAAYARVAYGRELLGRTDAAVAAMRVAATAAGGAEAAAWTRVQLAELELGRGRVAAAERHLRDSLAAFPGYAPALDALARAHAARGGLGAALSLSRRAVATAPLPQFAATLAELAERAGDRRLAREQYRLVDALARLLRASGVRADVELALFDADRGVRVRRAVALARRAHADAPSIHAADALSWALARAGRCGEARRRSQEALRLGTREASLWFHRGMIERCLGRDRSARRWLRRALGLDPHFSVRWAPVARELAG